MMKVKVYRFKCFDGVTGDHVISIRMATRSTIERINAEIIESTETEVYPSDVDSGGFSTIDFLA
jgi:hypothetical protein